MTKRKSPRDAGMPREIATALARCHEWLNNHARPPKVLDDLAPEQRAVVQENCRMDPRLLAALGPAAAEDSDSQASLVRDLLAELIAAKQLDDLPDLRRAAVEAGRPEDVLLDDARTRKALPLLEHGLRGLALLRDEAEDRNAALPGLGFETDHPATTLDLVRRAESILRWVIAHARGAMGADPPSSLAEFKTFRAWWASRLEATGFSYDEIESLLGYDAPDEPGAQLRLRDAVRKNCKRGRERGRAV